MKSIEIAVVLDEDYRGCYWANSRQEVRRAVQKAAAKFSKAFPEVSFVVSPKIAMWNSGLPKIRDFPMPLLMEMPRLSCQRAINSLRKRIKRLGFKRGTMLADERQLGRYLKNLATKKPNRQFWYLMGFFHAVFMDAILDRAQEDFPVSGPREIVLVFTGKLFVLESQGCAGVARFEGNHTAIGIQLRTDLAHIILHELGHIFGANHPRSERIKSVMATGRDDCSDFDRENAKLIRACLKKKGLIE